MQGRLAGLLGDRLVRRFFGAAGVALALRIAWAVLNYAGVVLLARWLTGADYGRYAFVMSMITFLAAVCGLGAQTAIMRFVGQYQSHEQPGLARGAVAYAGSRVFMVSAAVAALGIVGVTVGGVAGWIDRPMVYALGFAILPPFTVIDVQSGAARAYGALISALGAKDVFWRASLIPLAFLVTAYLVQPAQLPVLLAGAGILIAAAAAVQRSLLWRAMPAETRAAAPQRDAALWRSVATPIWLAAISNASLSTMDVMTLGLVLPKEQVGWYFAASRTAALVSFVLVSTNMILGPEVSRLYHAGETGKLRRLLKVGSIVVFTPSAIAFIACAFFGDSILRIFGPDFIAVRWELTILAAGQAINAATGCVGVLMNMTGHQTAAARIQVTTALGASLAIVAGASLFGMTGAAVATALGVAVWNFRMWWYVRTRTAFDPSVLGIILPPPAVR